MKKPGSKRLLVNADDFGLSQAINEGIIKSHVDGIVTSTSIVAAGEAFDDAVANARAFPAMSVGVHLTLIEENSVSERAAISSLAPFGVLPKTYGALMKGLLSGLIRLPDIERELRAQIEKCLAKGLDITHLDSHQHTHAYPSLFRLVVRLANDYRIKGIRIPRCWPKSSDFMAERFAPKCILCLLAHWDASIYPLGTCVATSHFSGLFESGALDDRRLLLILAELQVGTTELVCHPGCPDPSPRFAKWNLGRQMELSALTSGSVKNSIRTLGIELVNYRQI